jgi:hypothetical protein
LCAVDQTGYFFGDLLVGAGFVFSIAFAASLCAFLSFICCIARIPVGIFSLVVRCDRVPDGLLIAFLSLVPAPAGVVKLANYFCGVPNERIAIVHADDATGEG